MNGVSYAGSLSVKVPSVIAIAIVSPQTEIVNLGILNQIEVDLSIEVYQWKDNGDFEVSSDVSCHPVEGQVSITSTNNACTIAISKDGNIFFY